MYTLTETQYQALLQAIQEATNPTLCSYSMGCIVGKLCDFYKVAYPEKDTEIYCSNNKADLPFPIELLQKLQTEWDNPSTDMITHVEELKQKVTDLLNQLVQIQPELPLEPDYDPIPQLPNHMVSHPTPERQGTRDENCREESFSY